MKQYLPIVSMARHVCTNIKEAKLASTRAISDIVIATPTIDNPGHP